MNLFIAVDPGVNGGFAWGSSVRDMQCCPMPEETVAICEKIREIVDVARHSGYAARGIVENVNGYAGNDAGTSQRGFVFGENVGACLAALTMLRVPIYRPTPQMWQRMHGVSGRHLTKSQHKSQLNDKAKFLFPRRGITLKTADAALMFELCVNNALTSKLKVVS